MPAAAQRKVNLFDSWRESAAALGVDHTRKANFPKGHWKSFT